MEERFKKIIDINDVQYGRIYCYVHFYNYNRMKKLGDILTENKIEFKVSRDSGICEYCPEDGCGMFSPNKFNECALGTTYIVKLSKENFNKLIEYGKEEQGN